jgi:hypothetical protein
MQSALQQLQLVGFALPVFRVWHGVLHLGDVGPDFGEFRIQLQEYLLVFGQFVFRENGVNWTLWLTQGAVDTLVRVNNQEVGAFVKTVYGANFHAIRVFTVDTIFTNNECHSNIASMFVGGLN